MEKANCGWSGDVPMYPWRMRVTEAKGVDDSCVNRQSPQSGSTGQHVNDRFYVGRIRNLQVTFEVDDLKIPGPRGFRFRYFCPVCFEY